jgi:hypothetical protein
VGEQRCQGGSSLGVLRWKRFAELSRPRVFHKLPRINSLT